MTTVTKQKVVFKSHKEWEAISKSKTCFKILERYYKQNKNRYRHIKHAFNSLCKHVGEVNMSKITIKEDGIPLMTFWMLKSPNKTEVFRV